MEVPKWNRIRNYEIMWRTGIEETLTEKVEEECYDGLDRWKALTRGAGQENSTQLQWNVNRTEEGLGSVGKMK